MVQAALQRGSFALLTSFFDRWAGHGRGGCGRLLGSRRRSIDMFRRKVRSGVRAVSVATIAAIPAVHASHPIGIPTPPPPPGLVPPWTMSRNNDRIDVNHGARVVH